MNFYFISFGVVGKNLGVVCTHASSGVSALKKVSDLGLNPGGEAAIWPISSQEAKALGCDRLISPDEMRQRNYKSRKQVSANESKSFLSHAEIVCSDCNNSLSAVGGNLNKK